MFQWTTDNIEKYTLINNYKLSIAINGTTITDATDNTIQKTFPYPTTKTSPTVAHETALRIFKEWLFYEFYHMCTVQYIIHDNYHWNDDWYNTAKTTKTETWVDNFIVQTKYHDDNTVTVTIWQQTDHGRIKINEIMSNNKGEVGNRGIGVQSLSCYVADRLENLKQTKRTFETKEKEPNI